MLSSFASGFGGSGTEYISPGRATDSAGSSYISGYSDSPSADFDPGAGMYNLNGAGGNDAFLAKYAADGSLAWARRVGGPGTDFGHAALFASEPGGNFVYWKGAFSGSVDFGAGVGTLTSIGMRDVFLAKLDADTGATVWAKHIGMAGASIGGDSDLAVADGKVSTTGYLSGTMDFDPGAGVTNLSSAGSGYVWTLDSNGNYVAAWQLPGAELFSLIVEGTDLYTRGRYSGTVDFDPGAGVQSRTSVGSRNLFAARYSIAGQSPANPVPGFGWVQSVQVDNWSTDIMSSDVSSLYVGAGISSTDGPDGFLASFSKANGAINWTRTIGGPGDETVCSTVATADGALYVSGRYSDASYDFNPSGPGGEVVNAGPAGTSDVVVLKLNSATGEFQQVWSWGGSGDDRSLIYDVQGTSVYVASRFQVTAAFPNGSTLTSTGGYDGYALAFDEAGGQVSLNSVSQTEGNAGSSSVNFTVARSGDTSGTTTVNWSTADGTATSASGDYVAASGQVTFGPTETTKSISVMVNGDTVYEADETFTIRLSSPTAGTVASGIGQGTIVNDDAQSTKFYVVNDGSPDRTYEYSASGAAIENYAVNTGNSAPRGAASTAAGDKVWVVDANKKVYVYDTAGGLLGSWTAGSLANNADVQGIATNGADVWIVDAKGDKVYRYTGAATRLSGSQNAASSFSLNSSNGSPTDLVSDGASIWVLNDSSTDKVFKYTVSGSLVGSWTINSGGGSPTGITIDPASVSNIWIVDAATDRVYQFDAAASRTSGSQSPSTSFALAAGNTNPQGLADPPAPTGGASDRALANISSALSGVAALAPSTAAFDEALLAITGQLDGLISGRKRR